MSELVAIVGKTNVGKSTFFNKICGERISIVKDTPSVTRDRIYGNCTWRNKDFVLIDTGGIEFSKNSMDEQVFKQTQIAIDTAKLILFFVDAKSGLTSTDFEIATMLKKSNKQIKVVVNKLDVYSEEKLYEFYKLNLGDPIGISAEQLLNLGDLLDEIVKNLSTYSEEDIDSIKIAIVGKPNVGKSTFTNSILGFDRVIVSDTPGTTRDSIDTNFRRNNKLYTIIDTAGIRRQRGIEKDSIEDYAVLRSLSAISRADVNCIIMDSTMEISQQDVRIAGLCHENGKPSVVLFNKFDMINGAKREELIFDIKDKLKFMNYVLFDFVSAKNKKNLTRSLDLIDKAYINSQKKVPTSTLNDILNRAILTNPPPSPKGKQLKFYYISQVSIVPPQFIISCNLPTLVHFSYERYLENEIKNAIDFAGTPIKLIFSKKDSY